MKNLLCLLIMILVVCFVSAQEHKPTGVTINIAMQSDTIVAHTIICDKSKIENPRQYTGIFEENSINFRTTAHPDGINISADDTIAFTLQPPFPDLQGKISEPYSGARLTKIEGTLVIYLAEDDLLLVQDSANAQRIKTVPRQHYYQLSFFVDNIPAVLHQWNQFPALRFLPFHFSPESLLKQKVLLANNKGQVLGPIYRIEQWHLAKLQLNFVYEYATIDYQPLVKKPEMPDLDKVMKDNAVRDLDKAFTAINATFTAKQSSEVLLHLYSLMTAIKNIDYYARQMTGDNSAELGLLAQKVKTLSEKIENKQAKPQELTATLNEVRQQLIKTFTAIYKPATKEPKSK